MTKKICKYLALGSLAVVLLLLIIALVVDNLFKGNMFSETFWKIEGTIGVVFIVSLIAINVAELIEQKNILAIVSLALMVLSAVILLILIWNSKAINDGANSSAKVKVCWSIVITSFLVTFVLNPMFKLQKRFFAMQVVTWVLLGIIYVEFMLWALFPDGAFVNNVLNQAIGVITLWIPCIVTLGLEVACVILAKGKRNEIKTNAMDKTITISKQEYDALVNENINLKKKIEELSK